MFRKAPPGNSASPAEEPEPFERPDAEGVFGNIFEEVLFLVSFLLVY